MSSPESRPANLHVNRKMAANGDREAGVDPMALQQGDPGLLESDVACGEEEAREYLAQIDYPGTRMARIDLHPAWVGVHGFQSRLPSAVGGIS